MKRISSFFDFKNNSREVALSSILVVVLFFAGMASYASAATQAVTLTVTVNQALTFAITNNNFSTINPGTPVMATTTLIVNTNDTLGYFVSLSGDNKTAVNNNLETAGNTFNIPDQTEWIPGTATTSVGNAVQISSLTNSGNVLAYRVMSASSTNGVPFLAPTWWGTQDNYLTSSANTLYAGISSSTVQRKIGNTSVYSAAAQINTVQYYLNVAATQATGVYNAPITYTATGN